MGPQCLSPSTLTTHGSRTDLEFSLRLAASLARSTTLSSQLAMTPARTPSRSATLGFLLGRGRLRAHFQFRAQPILLVQHSSFHRIYQCGGHCLNVMLFFLITRNSAFRTVRTTVVTSW